MMKDVIYLCAYLATEFINYLLVYGIIFQAEITKRKGGWAAALSVIAILHLAVLHYAGFDDASAMSCLTMLVVPLFLMEEREQKWFLLYPFVIAGTAVVITSISFLFGILMDIPEYNITYDGKILLLCQCVPTVAMFIVWGYRKIRKYQPIEVQLGLQQYLLFYLGVFCLMLMMSSMQSLSNGDLSQQNINTCGLGISVACIIFVVLILWQGIAAHEKILYQKQNEIYQKQMELQQENFRQIMEQDEKMRRFRHDMNAHIAVLKSYCGNEDNEEFRHYLENMIQESAIYEMGNYTGNKGVDAVIRQLVQEAENKHISMSVEGNLSAEMKVTVYDFCTILSNLIKNSVEACEKIENVEDRRIEIKICSYNAQVYLEVGNTVPEDVVIRNNHLSTTKSDKKNHGIGSRNVERTVNKYGGELEYQCKNKWFWVEVTI